MRPDLSLSTQLSENESQPGLVFAAGHWGKTEWHGSSAGGCASSSPLKLGLYPGWGPHGQRALNFSSCGHECGSERLISFLPSFLFFPGRPTSEFSGLRVCHQNFTRLPITVPSFTVPSFTDGVVGFVGLFVSAFLREFTAFLPIPSLYPLFSFSFFFIEL